MVLFCLFWHGVRPGCLLRVVDLDQNVRFYPGCTNCYYRCPRRDGTGMTCSLSGIESDSEPETTEDGTPEAKSKKQKAKSRHSSPSSQYHITSVPRITRTPVHQVQYVQIEYTKYTEYTEYTEYKDYTSQTKHTRTL